MGWQDDPVVGGDKQSSSGGGWQSDPVVGSKPAPADGAAKTPSYDDSWAGYGGNILYRGANTGTLGALDYVNAGVHALGGEGYGDALTKIQKSNQDWGADHPYAALGADLAGYTLGAGKIGLGARLAEGMGGRLAARMAGAGLENAGATAVSDVTGSQFKDLTSAEGVGNLIKDSILSGTVGAATGGIPGSKGKLADEASQTPALKTATSNAFAPLKNAEFHPGDIGPAYDGAVNSVGSGTKVKLDSDFKAKMGDISQELADKYKANKPVTADDIASYSQALRDNAPTKLEQDVAGDLDKSLHAAMSNAPVGGSGGYQSGAAVSQAIKDATAAAEKSNASQNIDDWIKQAQRKPGTVPDSVNEMLTKNQGFFKAPGLRSALEDVATPTGIGSKLVQAAAHPLANAAIGGTITAGGNLLLGNDPATSLLEGVGTGIGGAYLGHVFAQKRTNDLVNKLMAARHLNATGQPVSPAQFRPGNRVMSPLAAYAPRVGVGVGASNLFDNISQ